MKTKVMLMGLSFAVLLSIVAWSAYGQKAAPANVSYEYKVMADPTETGGMDDGLSKLNDIGAGGWELVGVTCSGNSPAKLYFKRARR